MYDVYWSVLGQRLEIRVVELGDVGSTMDEARNLGAVDEMTVVVARSQAAGVGRFGRRWYSPPGGLWFTVITYPRQSATASPLLTLSTSLAVCRGISKTTGLQPSIRWPNDIYLNGRKVGGVLAEMDVVGDTITRALLGVGVNANFEVDELPEQVRAEATTLRHELGSEISLQQLLSNILAELRDLYESFKAGWRLEILRDIKEGMEMMGEPVSIHLSQGTQLIAVLEDLDELGRIAVRLEQDRIFLSPGDIERITPL